MTTVARGGRVVSGWCQAAVLLALAAPGARADDATAPAKAPAPLDRASARMTVPEGFHVALFAGEPDVRQPIALTFDPRGRLWVAECFSYPDWEMKGRPGRDRVVVFEDADGDGRFDRRTVFWDRGANVSGLEVGFGGVWVSATPNLLFIPDRDGDDRPDGPPEVVLDGWSLQARHNVVNGLTWGPDGWLWGCNGILSDSRVGPPGTPADRRPRLNCGVWRYHPTRKTFEAVAHGTTNPWGLDFDDLGEAFITNCVIPHLFHVVPGAHFQRMFGEDLNPHTYGLLSSCADHVHWDIASEQWLDIRKSGVTPTTDKLGGGHAHSGAAVYLGDNWPERYRNSVLMGNIHGNRLNRDRLERSGSGYVARHEPDFLLANDSWFRSVAQKVGPDGALYVLDWSDTGECHEDDSDGAHRENGRIYRVAYGTPKPARSDLAALPDAELVTLQGHRNDWQVRQARRLLQERAEAGRDLSDAHKALRTMLDADPDETRKLRALWALHVTNGIDAAGLTGLLNHPGEHVRAWAVRLLVDDPARSVPAGALDRFAGMARRDPSPRVRLALASALQRLPLDRRAGIAEGLMGHPDDARDANLPLMVWYGVEPVVPGDLDRASRWAVEAALPALRRNVARRAVEADEKGGVAAILGRLAGQGRIDPDAAADALAGTSEALRGRVIRPAPEGWSDLSKRLQALGHPDLTDETLRLGLTFSDARAYVALSDRIRDRKASVESRRTAIEILAGARRPSLVRAVIEALDVSALRLTALRALAAFRDQELPGEILKRYNTLPEDEREAAVQTLASRPEWAMALLEAVGRKEVPRRDVSATVVRQLQAFRRPEIDDALARNWGTLRPTAPEKAALIARYKSFLSPGELRVADLSRGRLVFQRTCQPCHKMYGEGGDVGPELTGSDRANLDYVLQNVLDPSASVAGEYRVTNVATADGRLVSGLLREQSPSALVVQTVNGRVVVPRDEVEEVRTTSASMMPEGLLEPLTDAEVRDLVAYLASRSQPPLPGAGGR